jgi:adenylate cyclase
MEGMDSYLGNGNSYSLDQQVQQVYEQARQILTRLQNGNPSPRVRNRPATGSLLASEANIHLARLADALAYIGDLVSEHENERANLQALATIAQLVNSSLQLDDVLCVVMDTIVRLTGAERGFLMLRDEHGELSIRIARNWEQATLEPSERDFSRTVIHHVVRAGNPILTTNARQDPRFGNQESVIAQNLHSILCVPLKVKGDLTGVIYADHRVRTGLFTETQRDLLAAFANQAAFAIENARLFESVRSTLAEVTELKGLMDDVFASIASGVLTTDLDDKITLSNRAAEAILGTPRAGLQNRSIAEVLPGLANQLGQALASVRQTNRQVIGLEINPLLPRRGQVSLSLNLSPLKDADQTTRGVAMVLEDLTEKKRLQGQHRLFERMVAPAVIEQLDPDQLQLGGRRAIVTTLFADVRDFTGFSERCAPEQLVAVLNRYLGAATEAILAEAGTVDKFMGDAVMALFNAPLPQPDHTLRAVRAALRMRAAISSLHAALPEEFRLSFGIGIHCGEAVLGLIGSEKRLDYTAIGDSINTAKRIQENAASCQILISSAAYQQVRGQVEARPGIPLLAKGKSQPLQVFEVLGLSDSSL